MRKFLIFCLFPFSTASYADNILTDESVPYRLSLLTDIKFSKTATGSSSDASGVGFLGIKFQNNFVYGTMTLNAVSTNSEVNNSDSSENNTFANNLLDPNKSGRSIGSFFGSLGVLSFYPFDQVSDDEPIFSLKRLGFLASYQINNTIWTKDTISTNVVIGSFKFLLTYRLLSLRMQNEDQDAVYLTPFIGFSARRLGGNFGMEKNAAVRELFLGDTRIGYNALDFGARLDLGKWYGTVNYTNFQGDIDDFSGNQVLITLGVNVDLSIAAKGSRVER